MRSLCSALLCAFLAVPPAPPAVAQSTEDVVRSAVVAVAAVSPEGRVCGTATAFHTGRGRFFTNAHVIEQLRKGTREGCPLWFVLQARETRLPDYPIAIVRASCIDPRFKDAPGEEALPFDVAVLEVQELGVGERLPPALPLARRAPRVGEAVRIVGFPSSIEPIWFDIRGTVAEVSKTRLVIDNRTTGAIPGISGSPVLDGAGRVAGIVYGVNMGARRAAALPISTALEHCHP